MNIFSITLVLWLFQPLKVRFIAAPRWWCSSQVPQEASPLRVSGARSLLVETGLSLINITFKVNRLSTKTWFQRPPKGQGILRRLVFLRNPIYSQQVRAPWVGMQSLNITAEEFTSRGVHDPLTQLNLLSVSYAFGEMPWLHSFAEW